MTTMPTKPHVKAPVNAGMLTKSGKSSLARNAHCDIEISTRPTDRNSFYRDESPHVMFINVTLRPTSTTTIPGSRLGTG